MKNWMLVILLVCSSVWAGESVQIVKRSYNPATVKTLKGTIVGVDVFPRGHTTGEGVYLMVQSQNGKMVKVDLGPRWYVERKEIDLQPGMAVEVEGSLLYLDRKWHMIASKLSVNESEHEFRGQDGIPVWPSVFHDYIEDLKKEEAASKQKEEQASSIL